MLAGGLILFALLASAAWFLAQTITAERKRPELAVFGDVPWIPEEMRTTTRKGGGERAEQERPSAKPDTFARHVGKTTKL